MSRSIATGQTNAYYPSSLEIFNVTIENIIVKDGILFFKAPRDVTISTISVQIFEKKGVTSGTLELDIKASSNKTPNGNLMTSIFTTKPSLDFSLSGVVDYSQTVNQALNQVTNKVAAGDFLRLDITSIPTGFHGSVHVVVHAM
jgi:hypothetical protein